MLLFFFIVIIIIYIHVIICIIFIIVCVLLLALFFFVIFYIFIITNNIIIIISSLYHHHYTHCCYYCYGFPCLSTFLSFLSLKFLIWSCYEISINFSGILQHYLICIIYITRSRCYYSLRMYRKGKKQMIKHFI